MSLCCPARQDFCSGVRTSQNEVVSCNLLLKGTLIDERHQRCTVGVHVSLTLRLNCVSQNSLLSPPPFSLHPESVHTTYVESFELLPLCHFFLRNCNCTPSAAPLLHFCAQTASSQSQLRTRTPPPACRRHHHVLPHETRVLLLQVPPPGDRLSLRGRVQHGRRHPGHRHPQHPRLLRRS